MSINVCAPRVQKFRRSRFAEEAEKMRLSVEGLRWRVFREYLGYGFLCKRGRHVDRVETSSGL